MRFTPLQTRMLRLAASLGLPFVYLITRFIPTLAPYSGVLNGIAILILLAGFLTFIDPARKLRDPRNLAIVILIVIFSTAVGGFIVWRAGRVIARANFNPGIAPFDISVRKVPVPVTASHHFIVTLSRGQYPVTSFRFFWMNYTPKTVNIEWTQLEHFKVIFDDRYVATCNWSWGREATWSMDVPVGAEAPGA